MNPSNPSTRRKREVALNAEALETRSLMTAGAGDTFAIIPGTISKSGEIAAIKFTIDPSHFKLPNGKVTLGVDVAADPTSALKPMTIGVKDANGRNVPQTFHSNYDPHLSRSQVGLGKQTSAVLTTLKLDPKNPTAPATYEVMVRGLSATTGKFLLGFYLPGDANGDGKVDQADINAVKASMGARAGDSRYSFDADANRDGRINAQDLRYTQTNLGASTDITPVVGANLDPAGMVDVNQRVTRNPAATFTGTLTPGGVVKFEDAAGKVQPVATTADAKGNYSITVPLSEGSNTFKVTTLDAFGQSITGTLAPVSYSKNPPVTTGTGGLTQQSDGKTG